MNPFQLIAENRIREAMENGEFDHLPGEGKPLNFDELERIPAEYRMVYRILTNSGYDQPETDIVKQIRLLKAQARALKDDPKAAAMLRLIERKEAELLARRNRLQK